MGQSKFVGWAAHAPPTLVQDMSVNHRRGWSLARPPRRSDACDETGWTVESRRHRPLRCGGCKAGLEWLRARDRAVLAAPTERGVREVPQATVELTKP